MSAAVISYIRVIALRDLRAVRREVEAYPDEDSLWALVPGISNPGGNLALHLAGNMHHYTGTVLGKTGYERDREAEFAARNVPRQQILQRLDEAMEAVDNTLGSLTDDDLSRVFPEDLGGLKLSTGQFLIHMLAHMGYHMGQLDYHRRMITQQNVTVQTQSIPELEEIPD